MAIMSDGIVAEVADRLWQAEMNRSPISPITDTHPELGIEDAYAIQAHNIQRRVGAGRVIRGRKVGLTAKPMQDLFGVREPDFGVLLDDMFVEDGDEVLLDTLLQPRVEAEMAFLIGRDLAGPGITTSNALAAIAGVLPSIEIVDSRIADWKIKLIDTVADNASSAKLVIGGKLTRITDFDLRLAGMVITRNGTVIDSGAGAAALGNPARCVAWLANKLAAFGACLRRDDIVIPGALHRMVPAGPRDVFRAEFAYLGAVTVRFSSGPREAGPA
jgi:2-keto-4-pentenoate hydratase